MVGCKLIEKSPNLSNLKKLKILIAFFCEKLTEIRGLEELKSLKLLDISGCKSIERLPDLSDTRMDKNSSRAKYWEANGWDGYVGSYDWNRWESKEWELEEWEVYLNLLLNYCFLIARRIFIDCLLIIYICIVPCMVSPLVMMG